MSSNKLMAVLENDRLYNENMAGLGARTYAGQVDKVIAANVQRWLVRAAIRRAKREEAAE